MKIKIPKEIKIAARNYKISMPVNLLRDEGNRGCVYWHKQIIEIAPNLSEEQIAVSFLHECVHVIDEHMAGRGGISEEITSGLAEGLFQLLKDNLGIEFDWSLIKEN